MLMCLAEALLRIPDAETADALIHDKLARRRLGAASRAVSDSLFVNASTWALMLTGRVHRLDAAAASDLAGVLRRLVARAASR